MKNENAISEIYISRKNDDFAEFDWRLFIKTSIYLSDIHALIPIPMQYIYIHCSIPISHCCKNASCIHMHEQLSLPLLPLFSPSNWNRYISFVLAINSFISRKTRLRSRFKLIQCSANISVVGVGIGKQRHEILLNICWDFVLIAEWEGKERRARQAQTHAHKYKEVMHYTYANRKHFTVLKIWYNLVYRSPLHLSQKKIIRDQEADYWDGKNVMWYVINKIWCKLR